MDAADNSLRLTALAGNSKFFSKIVFDIADGFHSFLHAFIIRIFAKNVKAPIDNLSKKGYNEDMAKVLSDEQRRVAENLTENILLFASAGTGKTFTVAHRVANILSGGQAPEGVLCLTFTVKAAGELREDVQAIAGVGADKICAQTVHGFCYRIVKEEERRRNERYSEPQVIDEVDGETLLESIYLAKATEWKIADTLIRHGRKESVEDLKMMPLLQREGELGWALDGAFLSRNGILQRVPAPYKYEKPTDECPICRNPYGMGETVCAVCGRQLPEITGFPHVEPPTLFTRKKNPLVNIVTNIRHVRAEFSIDTGDERADYQTAWNVLKAKRTESYLQSVSYFKQGYGKGKSGREPNMETDESVDALLSTHAGDLTVEYQRLLQEANQLDFDDLILRTDAYLSDEETRTRYASRYRYIIIDEMQDTSVTEYRMLKKLFYGNNVMMCGDFFQTIYGWRGSNPDEVLGDFQREFTPAVYAFKENYRATKTLAEASFGYLKNTYPELLGKFFPKDLNSHSEKMGEKIVCVGFDNYREEAAQVYAYLQKNRPLDPTDVCIMARSNGYIATLAQHFERLNALQKREEDKLRFFTVEKDHAFFKRSCIKDILAVLKLLVNPTDRIAMERIAGKYIRGVGAKSLEVFRGLGECGLSVVSFLEERAVLGKDPYQVLIDGAKNGEIVVYDTETTGLDLSVDEMVQLSAVRLDADGEIVDTLDLMIEPTVPIGQGAYETHGFDLEYIRAHGGVTAREALERFSAFASGCVLVGHNSMRFDAPLVRRQLKEQGLPPLPIAGEFDTLTLAKTFLQGMPDYKLSTLCTRYGVINEAAHNALGDITATAKVLWKLLQENVLPTMETRLSYVERYAEKFQKFYAFYCGLRELLLCDRVQELVPSIIARMRLNDFYPAEADKEAMRDLSDALSGAAVYDGEAFLTAYLADAALSGSQMDLLLKKLQKIPMVTVHQAKGCEFSTVILVGVSERFFPSSMSRGTAQEEEEKKVFYVAITRAKERLFLTRVTTDSFTGKRIAVSPYFYNIPQEYVHTDGDW